MPEDKDELLKKQNEEIQKLKKELKAATKPSSMFSVFKNTVKRNVHDFFVREDKMKSMDSRIKKLEQELEKKEDELNKTSAELFAAVNLGQSDGQKKTSPDNGETINTADAQNNAEDGPVFPQTTAEAVKEYFGLIDLASFAKQYYSDKVPSVESDIHMNPSATAQESTVRKVEKESIPVINEERRTPGQPYCPPINSQPSTSHVDKNPLLKSGNEPKTANYHQIKNGEREAQVINKEGILQTKETTNPTEPELSSTKNETSAKINVKQGQPQENDLHDDTEKKKPLTITAKPNTKELKTAQSIQTKNNKKVSLNENQQPVKSTTTVMTDVSDSSSPQEELAKTNSNPKENVPSGNTTATIIDRNGKKKSKKDKRKNQRTGTGGQNNSTLQPNQEKKVERNTQNKAAAELEISDYDIDDDDSPHVSSSLKNNEQTKAGNTVAASGNLESSKQQVSSVNKEKPSKQTLSQKKSEIPNKTINKDKKTTSVSEVSPDLVQEEDSFNSDIELPDDFGIVIEPESPSITDLPDISSEEDNSGIFDELFNSDSDNWDDSVV